MKTKMIKVLSVLLVLLMLTASFAACGGKGGGTETSDTGSETTKSSGTITGPSGNSGQTFTYDVPDDLPDSLDYGMAEFHLLCDAQQYVKSFADTYTGDTINSAIYNRANTVQQRLNIDLYVDREDGTYNNMASFINRMKTMEAGCDLVLAYNMTPAAMAAQGLTYDMNQTAYLNFEKPWWSSVLLDNIAVDNKVYFTGDNASWNNLRNMQGIFVDKQLFTNNHPDMDIDDLYDLVEDKAWTMDKMFELTENTYYDKNQDNTVDTGDVFGLSIGNNVWIESFFYAAGFTTLGKDESGNWEFRIATTATIDFISYFQQKFYDSAAAQSCAKDSSQYKQFKEGRAQFYLSALAMVEQNLEQPFAVLPLPMYTTDQGRYYTHFSNTYDMYAIPRAVGSVNKDRSSAVLECLASEAYRQIAPAYFETYLKKQNVSDDRLKNMYDEIRRDIVFDQGYCYGPTLNIGEYNGAAENYPIYYVRRAFHNSDTWKNIADTFQPNAAAHLALWQAVLDKFATLAD